MLPCGAAAIKARARSVSVGCAAKNVSMLLYLPFLQTFDEMPQSDFIVLPIATAADVRARADRQAAK